MVPGVMPGRVRYHDLFSFGSLVFGYGGQTERGRVRGATSQQQGIVIFATFMSVGNAVIVARNS